MKTNPANITLTDKARAHIQHFLTTLGPQAGFRFGVKKSGCSGYAYVADIAAEPKTDELCFEENGIRIFIDPNPESIRIIKGTCIDLLEKEFGQKQLIFKNANVADSCGCGESFTVKSERADGE
jgi:iron-sulfur cluster assembly protein